MMPKPASPTFGDKRPVSPTLPKPRKNDDKPRRRLKDGCTFPEVKMFRQTNGTLYLTRFAYNGVFITGLGEDEATALDNAQQFYMRETAQGREDSEEVK